MNYSAVWWGCSGCILKGWQSLLPKSYSHGPRPSNPKANSATASAQQRPPHSSLPVRAYGQRTRFLGGGQHVRDLLQLLGMALKIQVPFNYNV